MTVKANGLPIWARGGDMGDVDGDPEKHDCKTEETPYAAMILRDLRLGRGTAYTQRPGTLVDAENLALARFMSAVYYRKPEKFRCNMLPGTSDERLPYWKELLALPVAPDEPKRITRGKLARHYRGSNGATVSTLQTELELALGEAFVSVSAPKGTDLGTPPTDTYWPGVNPGSASFSLGGGAWWSERCLVTVESTRPNGMSEGAWARLLEVDMFALLDRLLPAWANWETVKA